MIKLSKEDLSDKEFEAIVSSRGFQKMLLYRRFADGIEVLQTHDRLYESMVQAIVEQHSEIDSADTVQEVFSLLQQEVETYTEPLTDSGKDDPQLPDALGSAGDRGTSHSETEKTDPEQVVHEYLTDRLAEVDELKLKASEIATDIELPSTHIGGILGKWRHSDNPPFAITASESPGSGNVWHIKQTDSPEENIDVTESTTP
jgi:hypothetical protein